MRSYDSLTMVHLITKFMTLSLVFSLTSCNYQINTTNCEFRDLKLQYQSEIYISHISLDNLEFLKNLAESNDIEYRYSVDEDFREFSQTGDGEIYTYQGIAFCDRNTYISVSNSIEDGKFVVKLLENNDTQSVRYVEIYNSILHQLR